MSDLHQLRTSLVLCLVTLVGVTSAGAASMPFDISDPTSRAVQIWTDDDPSPAAYHVQMSPAFQGTWTSDGTTGVVRVDAATMAAFLAGSNPVPGSISDLTISINLATRDVTGIEFYGRLAGTVIGDVQFEYSRQSTPGPWTLHSGLVIPGTVGGIVDVPGQILSPTFASDLFGPNGPGSHYTVVPTAPYDPATG